MIITIVEANLDHSKWDDLKAAFDQLVGDVPVQIIQSLLVQNVQSPDSWKLITLWKSREAFADYRNTAATSVPQGLALFRSVGVEPAAFSLQNVMGSSARND
jgi:quinol monooxygenase YgiN